MAKQNNLKMILSKIDYKSKKKKKKKRNQTKQAIRDCPLKLANGKIKKK